MQTVMLQVEDGFLPTLKDILSQYPKTQVSIKEDKLSAELERRIQEIDNGAICTVAHSDIMDRVFEKWEAKCK